MKNNILINQMAAVQSGLAASLDIVDLAIFDFIYNFMNCPSDRKMSFIHGGKEYTEIRMQLLNEQMPLLKMTTKRTFINRMNRLIDAGLIERYENNGTENRSAFCRGRNFGIFVFGEPMKDVSQVVQNDSPCENDFTPPVKKISHNKSKKEKINNIYIPPYPPLSQGGSAETGEESDSEGTAVRDDSAGEEMPQQEKRKVARKEKSAAVQPLWRTDFSEYRRLVDEGAAQLKADGSFRAQKARLMPDVDYDATIDNCVLMYWGTEAAWEHKKRSHTREINMKATLRANFDKNRVYVRRQRPVRPADVDMNHVNDPWKEIIEEKRRRAEQEGRI